MADANRRSPCNFGYSKSNPFVTINDGDVEGTIDTTSEGDSYYGLSNVFHREVEPIKTRHAAAPCELIQPKFSSKNPFIDSEEDSYCFQRGVAIKQSDSCSHVHHHQPHVPPLNNTYSTTCCYCNATFKPLFLGPGELHPQHPQDRLPPSPHMPVHHLSFIKGY